MTLTGNAITLSLTLGTLNVNTKSRIVIASHAFLTSISDVIGTNTVPIFTSISLSSRGFATSAVQSILAPHAGTLVYIRLTN